MLFPNGANRNKILQLEMAMEDWNLVEYIACFLTEKSIPKEHKNVEFKNLATEVNF